MARYAAGSDTRYIDENNLFFLIERVAMSMAARLEARHSTGYTVTIAPGQAVA